MERLPPLPPLPLAPRLSALVLLLLLLGCVSKGDTNVSSTGDTTKPTCTSVCRKLQAETFGSCKKWSGFDDCVGECEDHRPTDKGLSCVDGADTCEEFKACDSEYDLF